MRCAVEQTVATIRVCIFVVSLHVKNVRGLTNEPNAIESNALKVKRNADLNERINNKQTKQR